MPTPKEALQSALAAWNAGDVDGYLALYDEGVTLHGYTPEPMSKAEAREFYVNVMAAFDNPSLDFHEVLWHGEDTCTIRFTMGGRHAGEFMGVPATGTQIALPGITILRYRDGRCVERWSQADMLGLLVQLGAIPAPA